MALHYDGEVRIVKVNMARLHEQWLHRFLPGDQ